MDMLQDGDTGTKESFRKVVDQVGNHIVENSAQSAIIYESTKAYSLGKSFEDYGGFHGTSWHAKELDTLLTDLNLTVDSGINLTTLLLNTAPYAIASDKKNEIEKTLARNVAYFLFDDYKTIGNAFGTTHNAIHIFNLSHIYVPLSYLLYRISNALANAERNLYNEVRFNLTYPSSLYHDQIPGFQPARERTWYHSNRRWRAEQKNMWDGFKLEISFLQNFKNLLKGDLNILVK